MNQRKFYERKYLLPYPYTITISFLMIINVIILYFIKDTPSWNWNDYFEVLGYSFIAGFIQIVALENLQNVPCWFFPRGSSLAQKYGLKYGNVALEDILFIPSCGSIFYIFMFLNKNIENYMSSPELISSCILIFFMFEVWVWFRGGTGAKDLIVIFTMCPVLALCVLSQCDLFDFKTINFTHMVYTYVFVMSFSSIWEFFNVWRRHWIYDDQCRALSGYGWFLDNKLHIAIFFQYANSGFVFIYFCWLVFVEKKFSSIMITW